MPRLQRLNAHYHRTFTFDDLWAEIWRRVYAFRQRAFKGAEAVASACRSADRHRAGCRVWQLGSPRRSRAPTGGPPVPAYDDRRRGKQRIAPRRHLSDNEWDELIAVMKERRIAALDADGLMTDAVLARVAELDHVTALEPRRLAAAHATRGCCTWRDMPQLQHLEPERVPRRQAHRSRTRGPAASAEPSNVRDDLAARDYGRRRRESAVLRSTRARQPDGIADRRRRDRGAARQTEASSASAPAGS